MPKVSCTRGEQRVERVLAAEQAAGQRRQGFRLRAGPCGAAERRAERSTTRETSTPTSRKITSARTLSPSAIVKVWNGGAK